jgi:dUTP pyrophosphatase
MFRIAKVNEDAKIPTRGSKGAAGYDLSSIEEVSIAPGERAMIDTGIIIEVPSDCYARVAPRSGLAAKCGIDVLAGVIDSDYRGNIKVILQNNGSTNVDIYKGDRIAQLIFERIYTPDITEASVEDLVATERGEGGFGSTGTN